MAFEIAMLVDRLTYRMDSRWPQHCREKGMSKLAVLHKCRSGHAAAKVRSQGQGCTCALCLPARRAYHIPWQVLFRYIASPACWDSQPAVHARARLP